MAIAAEYPVSVIFHGLDRPAQRVSIFLHVQLDRLWLDPGFDDLEIVKASIGTE